MTPVLVRRAVFGEGIVIPARFSLSLVDINNRQRVCFQRSTKAPILELRDVELSDEDIILALIPQDDIAIPAAAVAVYYKIEYELNGIVDSFLFSVPDSSNTQDLMDLIGEQLIPLQ